MLFLKLTLQLILLLTFGLSSFSYSQTISATFLPTATGCNATMNLSSTNAGSALTSNGKICIQLDYTSPTNQLRKIDFTSQLPDGIVLSIRESTSPVFEHTCDNAGTVIPSNTSASSSVTLIKDIDTCANLTTRYFEITDPIGVNTNFAEMALDIGSSVGFTFEILDYNQ